MNIVVQGKVSEKQSADVQVRKALVQNNKTTTATTTTAAVKKTADNQFNPEDVIPMNDEFKEF